MSDIANITVSGRLTKDAEVKQAGNGNDFIAFSVGNTTGFGDRERSNFYNVTVFGSRAKGLIALSHKGVLTKGAQVVVAGELSPRKYESNNGGGLSLDITASDVSVAFAPRDSGSSYGGNDDSVPF